MSTMTETKERPILFSASMIAAILAGTKTQTRRIVKLDLDESYDVVTDSGIARHRHTADSISRDVFCRYGQPGDRLYVRETWRYDGWTEDGRPAIRYAADDAVRWPQCAADVSGVWADLSRPENLAVDGIARDRKWRPSIFLPRWASRITLEVTEVRVERVQDISEADAAAEGLKSWSKDGNLYKWAPFTRHVSGEYDPVWSWTDMPGSAVGAYAKLWDQINGKTAPWASNPWVWCVSFRRVDA